jgi:hypothetical protein
VLAQLVDLARLAVRAEVRGPEHPQPAAADAPAVQRRILEPADPIATSVRRSSRSMMPSLLFNSSSTFGKRSRRSRHERHDHVQHERRRRVDA